MSSGGIQLRWKSYLGDMRALLKRLRRSEELTDVVLTNGSTSIKCHRVILSAACQTFHDLLKTHAGDVVICLGGVSSGDLTSLVDYMYSGEVEVAQGRLTEFLTLAGQWGVRGLEHSPDSHQPKTPDEPDSASFASELTAAEGRLHPAEMDSSSAAGVCSSRRSEPAAAGSTLRRQGRPQSDDSDSSSDEENSFVSPAAAESTSQRKGRSQPSDSDSSSDEEDNAPSPGISNAVLSVINPDVERNSKKRSSSTLRSPAFSNEKATSPAKTSTKKATPTKTSKTVKSHKARTSHPKVPNMFACPHCPRVFVKLHYFTTHLKIQHGDRTPAEQHRVRFSTGAGRTVQLAGGILTMKLPLTKRKKKTEKELEKKRAEEQVKERNAEEPTNKRASKELRKERKNRDRAAEAAAVVAAADAAVAAALARAAITPVVRNTGRTHPPVSGQKAPVRIAHGAPAKRTRVESSSDSDSDSSDSSVEVTATARGGVPVGTVAAVNATTATPRAPAPSSSAVQPPVAQPPPVVQLPPVVQPPQSSQPPPVARLPASRRSGIEPSQRAAEDAPRPSRIVFDQLGQPQPPAAAVLAPVEDIKPIVIPPGTEPLAQTVDGEAGSTTATAAADRRREERRRLLAWPQAVSERPRRDSLGAESDSSRGTRLVFDQEGRARPADAPPPVGIATHVRREPPGRDGNLDGRQMRREWEPDGHRGRGRGHAHGEHRRQPGRGRWDREKRRDDREGSRGDTDRHHWTSNGRWGSEDSWRERSHRANSPHSSKQRRSDGSTGGGDIILDRMGSQSRGGRGRGHISHRGNYHCQEYFRGHGGV